MIGDHGEAAFVVESDGDIMKFVSYTIPRRGENFEAGEIRNVFLAQTIDHPSFEEND